MKARQEKNLTHVVPRLLAAWAPKVSMEENELERFFELEPVPSPSCADHGRPRLFEGEMESRFDPDVPPP